MAPADLIGIWTATQAPPAVANQWVQPANDPWPRFAIPVRPIDESMHYFLVVRADADGRLSAFIRNPEANVGTYLGNRTVLVEGAHLRLRATDKGDVTGTVASDTLTIDDLPAGPKVLAFHRATEGELRWYYPRPAATWSYRVPAQGADGWPVGNLAAAAMRQAPIASLMSAIVSQRSPVLRSPYIQSIAIARHRRLVLDEYFYGFDASMPHDVRSAGKSVTSLMVGRAIEDTNGFALTTPVLAFLSQYPNVANDDPRKRRITVADLLTMCSGLACDDNDDNSPGNEDTMQAQSAQPDWYKYALDLPMQREPGSNAVYCTAGINLLGAIVARATQMPLEQYFYERFAGPMQFGEYGMILMPPPTDAAYMGGGDRFRPRDFLKFGELFLDGGNWNSRPVIGADWLAASVVQRAIMNEDAAGEGDRYGYGWHLATLTIEGRRYEIVDAGGNGGQIMAVVPALDMAVMITAGNYGQYPVWSAFLAQVVGAAIRAAT